MAHKQYRFYCHIWTTGNGHQDKRYLMSGSCPEQAYIMLVSALRGERPEGSFIIHMNRYERVVIAS
jgi:hypothetical protein